MQEINELKLIFDPGKGRVDVPSVTAFCGDRVGTLPSPVRKGCTFEGWFTQPEGQGERITSDSVLSGDTSAETGEVTLYAKWREPAAAAGGKKKKSSMAKQKTAIWVLGIIVAVFALFFIVVVSVIDIKWYKDFDNEFYTIKKTDGEYGIYHNTANILTDKDTGIAGLVQGVISLVNPGTKCDVNDDGYWLTTLGTQLELDQETGEYEIYAVVDTEGTEVVGAMQRVLAFKQLTYDQSSTDDMTRVISRYEVHNQKGEYALVRQEGSNRFTVEGHEGTLLSDELFAQFSVGCGYTISMMRLANPETLPDGSIDWAEYGLAPETRVKKNDDGTDMLDEDGNPVTYDYVPTWYVVSTLQPDARSGLSDYKMTIGDPLVSGAGYYARYEDRNTIYVLSSTNLDAAVLQPVETLVTPMLVYPMSMNSYFDVENFILEKLDNEYKTLYMAAVAGGLDPDTVNLHDVSSLTAEQMDAIVAGGSLLAEMDEETFGALYDKAAELSTSKVTGFSFVSISSRENTLYSSIPYRMSTDYMAGYQPNANNLSTVMQNLYAMAFLGVAKLGPDEEDMEEYGLLEPGWHLTFTYHDTNGQDHDNAVWISEMTEDGLYYAYSEMFDMICIFDESAAPFLGWEVMDWYEREYFSYNIAHITSMTMEGASVTALGDKYLKDGKILYELDNSDSDQSSAINSSELRVKLNGELIDYTLTVTKPSGSKAEETGVYNFRRLMQSLLTASLEGVADLTDKQMADFRATPDTDCQLKLTVILDDHYTKASTDKYIKAASTAIEKTAAVQAIADKNSTAYQTAVTEYQKALAELEAAKTAMETATDSKMNLVYRFYQYTERKSYMTIEVLPTPDAPSSPENAQGIFCVLRSFCDKIVTDAARLADQVEIDPDSKN